MVLGLSGAVWLFFIALLLFATLVIVKFAIELVLEAKRLARDVRKASGRLNDAQAELTTLMGEASERMDRVQATGRVARRARQARRQGKAGPPANGE